MKAYVIALQTLPQSLVLASRCIQSGKRHGVDVELFEGIDPYTADRVRRDCGLPRGPLAEEYANPLAVMGCFMSMFLLWRKIQATGKPAVILEHDAVFVGSLPDYPLGDLVNLGKPSYGDYREQSRPGIYPLFSKAGGYFPGTHGYYLSPIGASRLIQQAETDGVHATDLFLCRQRFDWIEEIYPWIVEARPNFSSVQNWNGVQAQHAYRRSEKLGLPYRTAAEIWRSCTSRTAS